MNPVNRVIKPLVLVTFQFRSAVLFWLYFLSSVTTVKPETVSVYQVKKTDKDTYKKKASWRLRDLKIVDGKDGTKVCFWLLIRGWNNPLAWCPGLVKFALWLMKKITYYSDRLPWSFDIYIPLEDWLIALHANIVKYLHFLCLFFFQQSAWKHA